MSNVLLIKNEKTLKERFGMETIEDRDKEKELLSNLLAFYNKAFDKEADHINYSMFDYDFYSLGYNAKYGYYVIEYYDSKSYIVTHYGEDKEKLLYHIAIRMLDKKRLEYSSNNKKEIKKDYKKRFKELEYYDDVLRGEYDLSIWDKYYDGNIPEEIVSSYEDSVNHSYPVLCANTSLKYNRETKQFEYADKVKVRSLKK